MLLVMLSVVFKKVRLLRSSDPSFFTQHQFLVSQIRLLKKIPQITPINTLLKRYREAFPEDVNLV